MRYSKTSFVAGTALLLASCAQTPMGPTTMVMPAPNKPFQVFQDDQVACKQVAGQAVQGQADAANQRAVGSVLVGVLLGAAVGAAAGGGNAQVTQTGAAIGATAGTAAGAGGANVAQMSMQGQYDLAYSQCMYSRGNQVPGFTPAAAAPPPPPNMPPPNAPPPPR